MNDKLFGICIVPTTTYSIQHRYYSHNTYVPQYIMYKTIILFSILRTEIKHLGKITYASNYRNNIE